MSRACTIGDRVLAIPNFGNGGFAESTTASAAGGVFPIPDSMPFAAAAAVVDSAETAAAEVRDRQHTVAHTHSVDTLAELLDDAHDLGARGERHRRLHLIFAPAHEHIGEVQRGGVQAREPHVARRPGVRADPQAP